jgi:hypothetical protein
MTTYVVDQSGGGDSVTINGAVAMAASGDTIRTLRGAFAEEVADSGKDLFFEGEGLVLLDGSSGLTSAITLTGNSSVSNFIIKGYTSHGINGGFFINAVEIYGCATGIESAAHVSNCLVFDSTTAFKDISFCGDSTIRGATTGVEDVDNSIGVIFSDVVTCHLVTGAAPNYVERSVFETSSITHYANINSTNYDTLASFRNVHFGDESGEEISEFRFLDESIDAYALSTANRLYGHTNDGFSAGYRPVATGMTPNVNESFLENGLFTGSCSYDGTKISGTGTASTCVFDFREARRLKRLALYTLEDIASGDKVEKTSGMLDVEYRASNTIFKKTDIAPVWNTLERQKGVSTAYQYWQFRLTLVGSAEVYGVSLDVERPELDFALPTWVLDAGVNTTTTNSKNGLDITFHDRSSALSRYRLFMKEGNAVDLFTEANTVGEFTSQQVSVAQLPDGTQLLDGTTYYLGARLVLPNGNTDSNEEIFTEAFSTVVSPPEPPDIEGTYDGDGEITIELVDAVQTNPNYRYTIIYEETSSGFTRQLGMLTNDGETLTVSGYTHNSAYNFIGVAVGHDGQRSYPSEEARVVTVDGEPYVETIYT